MPQDFRLGLGEFVPSGSNYFARWQFLAAVREHVPEALRALSQLVENTDPRLFDEWIARWGFSDWWLRGIAEETLQRWRDHPIGLTMDLRWHGHGVGWFQAEPLVLGWDPSTEREAEFRGRVEHYIEAIKTAQSEAQMVPSPEKRNAQHFDWLALYQVAGWTQARIVERYQDENGKPDVSAVSRALAGTATLIGLKLRPAQGRASS